MDRRRGVTSDEAINRRYPVWVEHAFRGTINEWKVHWDKIRARWNPFAGLPADQSEENGSVTGQKEKTAESGETRFTGSPTRTIILIAIGLGIVILALIPIVVVTLLQRAEDTPKDLLRSAKMQTTVLNRDLTDQLRNSSSPEYQSFETSFVSEIDKLYKNDTRVKGYYQGVVVDKIEETNSILVTFSVILLSDNNQIPSNEDLTQILKDTKDSTDPASETGKLGVFDIDIASIKVIFVITISESENPLRTTTTSSTPITVPPTTETTNAATIESTSMEVTNSSSPMTTQESTNATTATTPEETNTTTAPEVTSTTTATTSGITNTATATTPEETNTTNATMPEVTGTTTTLEITNTTTAPEVISTTNATIPGVTYTTTTLEVTNTTTAPEVKSTTTAPEVKSTTNATMPEVTDTTTMLEVTNITSPEATSTTASPEITSTTTASEVTSTTTARTSEITNTPTSTTPAVTNTATATTAKVTKTTMTATPEETITTTTPTSTDVTNGTTATMTEYKSTTTNEISTTTAKTTAKTYDTTTTTTTKVTTNSTTDITATTTLNSSTTVTTDIMTSISTLLSTEAPSTATQKTTDGSETATTQPSTKESTTVTSTLTIPSSIATGSTETTITTAGQVNVNLTRADMEVTVTNMVYTEQLANNTSKEYQDTVANFIEEVNALYGNSSLSESYEGVVVDKIENGSLVFFFALIFRAYVPSNEDLSSILEGTQNQDDQTKGNLGQFVIQIDIIVISSIIPIPEKENPLRTTKVPTTTQHAPTQSTSTISDTSKTTSVGSTAMKASGITSSVTAVSSPATTETTSATTESSTLLITSTRSTNATQRQGPDFTTTPKIDSPVVEFESDSRTLKIGEMESVACNAVNIQGWTNIKVFRSRDAMPNDVIAEIYPESMMFTSTQSSTTGVTENETDASTLAADTFSNRVRIAPSSVFGNNSAAIAIHFSNVGCGDDGIYHCRVEGDNFVEDESITISAIKTPSASLTIPPNRLVEDLWVNGITCVVNVGYPHGDFTWRVKYNGANDFQNYYSNVTNDQSNVTEDCLITYTKVLSDEMKPYSLWNNSFFQCAVENTSAITTNNGIVESNTQKIQFISANICEGQSPWSRHQHPYDTNFFIECHSNGSPVVVACADVSQPPSGCYVTTTTTTTQSSTVTTLPPGTPAVICPKTTTLAVGKPNSFVCDILNATVMNIGINRTSIVNGFEILLIETVISNSEVSLNIGNRISVFTEENIDRILLNVTFASVECEDGGTYSIKLNLGSLLDETEVVLSNPPSLPTLLLDSSVYEKQETTASCIGNLGNPKGKMELQIQLKNSSSFDTFEEDQATSKDDHCQNNATQTYSFYPTSDWEGATIRCIIQRDGSEESDQVVINVIAPVIQFQSDVYAPLIGEPAQLICEVESVSSLESVEIYRTVDGVQQSAVLYSNDTTFSEIPGARIDSSSVIKLTETTTTVLEFDSVACADNGTYYCLANGDTTHKTTALLTTRVKPKQKPTLTLSREIIENKVTRHDIPHKCTGFVGYPGGKLVIQSNRNARFEDTNVQIILHEERSDNCSNFKEIHFATQFGMDWNNTDLRCVIRNDETLGEDEEIVSSTQTVLVVPENYCQSFGNRTLVYHPYDCHHYVACSGPTAVGECGNLCWGINTENACSQCGDVICAVNKTEPSSSTMMSTTSTAATTQDPSPYIFCSGDETYTVNEPGTLTCTIYEVNLTSIEINRTSVAGEEIITAEDDIAMSTFSQTSPHFGHIVVESSLENSHIFMEVTFNPVGCEDDGVYHVSVNSAELEDSISMSITVSISKPLIHTSLQIYKSQITTITCDGQLGYPEGDMTLQVKYPEGTTFTTLTENVIVDSPEDNCYNNATLTYTFTPTSDWNNSVVRCTTIQGEVLETSDESTIELKEAVIYFTSEDYHFYIGTSSIIECSVDSFVSLTSVDIYKIVENLEKKATITLQKTKTSSISGGVITDASSISSTEALVRLAFDSFDCANEAEFFCRANGETIQETSVRVYARRKPTEPPQLAMDPTLIENKKLKHTCTGYVGYPAGHLVIQTNQDGEYKDLDLVNEVRKPNESDCSTYDTLSFENAFSLSFNNTYLRCIVSNNINLLPDDPIPTSDEFHMLLVSANYCGDFNITATPRVPHPYDCTKFIWCLSGDWVLPSDCPASLCFDPDVTDCVKCAPDLCP